MVAKVATCIMLISMCWRMKVWIQPVAILTEEGWAEALIFLVLFIPRSCTQQSSCSYNSKYNGVEISGSIQIKSGDEYSLMAAVANAGPVAVGVDASSKAFRVKTSPPECQDPSVHIIIPFPPFLFHAVLFLRCLQLAWLFQLLPDPCNGHHWVWQLQW